MIIPVLAAGLSLGSFAAATAVDEYDYVIVGSGPGGGSLAANLALSNQSVFLIEAGGDNSTNLLQRIQPLAARAAETPGHSWQHFVEHYEDPVQARRDPNYTYMQTNGSYYVGLEPPEGAVP
jgi:choline dehydrogenase